MINEIISGMARAIDEEFNSEEERYAIYRESIEQGLEEPCFLITCIRPKSSQFLGDRYYIEHQFMVQYFPESDRPRNECMDVQERLYEALEFITADGKLRNGTGMEGVYEDDVLHFSVEYNFFAERKETDTAVMEKQTTTMGVKM